MVDTLAGYSIELLIEEIYTSDVDETIMDVLLDTVDDEEQEWLEEKAEPKVELKREWNPFYTVKDREDLKFLQIALIEKVDPDMKSELMQDLENIAEQSARTTGYSTDVKTDCLHKNTPLKVTTSHRRLASVQSKSIADMDINRFKALKQRKKQLVFRKSQTSDRGVYTDERIEVNEFVLEYVGEVIRQEVAEKREREYERLGIGSSFLVRVSDDMVIDATKKGGLARFIGHCCTANCKLKIITVDKEKKVMVQAIRDIEYGEKITCNYSCTNEKMPCM